MPHFTRQIDAKGPLLNVQLGISASYHSILAASGVPIPQPRVAQGLVDTGASCTCIDPSVIRALQISPKGTTMMLTPSTGSGGMTVSQYDVSLSIYSTSEESPYQIPNLAVVESELFANQGFHVLIGRDVLARCVFIYNGERGNYTLAF